MFIRKGHNGYPHPDRFVSAKTATAIPARHPALHDALIQLSLDSEVRSLSYVASASVAFEPVELGATIAARADGLFYVDVVPARPLRDLDAEGLVLIALAQLGLKPIVITAEELHREPRYGNARLVWSYRHVPVQSSLRMRVLQCLIEEGPMNLGRLLRSLPADDCPLQGVLSMVCSNLIELDLVSRSLGNATMVKACT